jgi:hypothetical protein
VKKFMMLVALLGLASPGWARSAREASNDRIDHAGKVLVEIMTAPDKAIPEEGWSRQSA